MSSLNKLEWSKSNDVAKPGGRFVECQIIVAVYVRKGIESPDGERALTRSQVMLTCHRCHGL